MNRILIDYDDLYPGNLRFSADGNLTRLFVYLYLHSLFHPLQHTSQCTFCGPWNAPLPSYALYIESEASVYRLAPLHFLRTIARPVSCYALF